MDGWVNKGESDARKPAHARILLGADEAESGPDMGEIELGVLALDLPERIGERAELVRQSPPRRSTVTKPK